MFQASYVDSQGKTYFYPTFRDQRRVFEGVETSSIKVPIGFLKWASRRAESMKDILAALYPGNPPLEPEDILSTSIAYHERYDDMAVITLKIARGHHILSSTVRNGVEKGEKVLVRKDPMSGLVLIGDTALSLESLPGLTLEEKWNRSRLSL